VLPITSLGLDHAASDERISSGVPRLDEMLGGEGFYRGSSVLVSGTAGTGKSSLSAHFVAAACARGERALYFAFEESPGQIIRNMRSIGIDLEPYTRKGLLRFHAVRPTVCGLEAHLAIVHKLLRDFQPGVVVIDPISNLVSSGTIEATPSMLLRIVDHLKSKQITGFFTSLSQSTSGSLESTEIGLSSLMDTWLLLRDIELNGERNRGLYVLKSRGMAHSNQIREFVMSRRGIELIDVYLGPEGMLTGSARIAQEAREQSAELERKLDAETRRRASERKRKSLVVQLAAVRADLEAEEEALQRLAAEVVRREGKAADDRRTMARSRKAEGTDNGPKDTRKQGVRK